MISVDYLKQMIFFGSSESKLRQNVLWRTYLRSSFDEDEFLVYQEESFAAFHDKQLSLKSFIRTFLIAIFLSSQYILITHTSCSHPGTNVAIDL